MFAPGVHPVVVVAVADRHAAAAADRMHGDGGALQRGEFREHSEVILVHETSCKFIAWTPVDHRMGRALRTLHHETMHIEYVPGISTGQRF